jgi:hypothetical protein
MTGYAPLPPFCQRPMTQTQDFFVFITADPQLRGLSLMRTGENLPRLMDNRTWSPFVMASLTLDNLKPHALDPELALLNLKTKGFHIARITAQVLQFPQPNRHSA